MLTVEKVVISSETVQNQQISITKTQLTIKRRVKCAKIIETIAKHQPYKVKVHRYLNSSKQCHFNINLVQKEIKSMEIKV